LLNSCKHCAWLAAATLVVLRLAIGIHFFQEGTGKLADPQPFSAGFFGSAKGPLAPVYKGMVWDPDGRIRLGLPAVNDPSFSGHAFKPDPSPTLNHWEWYRDRVIRLYQFDDAQIKKAHDVTKTFAGRYQGVLRSDQEEIEEYYHQLIRRDANSQLPERNLESLKAQEASITGDRMKLRGPLLAKIDRLSQDLEWQLNGIATETQRQATGWVPTGRVGEQPLSASTMDRIIPYFDAAIGLCLIIGLLTRTAAVLGGLFLLSVCLAQWPGYPGSAPIYYQVVEMLALFALAANGAGKWMSVDSLMGYCCQRRSPPKQGDR
jgi:uncharacterized membrane protein YphA (DoxX/SURF4 family)